MKKLLPVLAGSLLLPLAGVLLMWMLQRTGIIGPEVTAFIKRNTLWIGAIALVITLFLAYVSSRTNKAKQD